MSRFFRGSRAILDVLPRLLRGCTSDASCTLLHPDGPGGWGEAAAVVAASQFSSSDLYVTSADGTSRERVSAAAFLRHPPEADVLTVSSDWTRPGEAMDGFVLGIFRRTSGVRVERYEFGMLNDLRDDCLRRAYGLFLDVERHRTPVLLVVDPDGRTPDADWIAAFRTRLIGTSTATLVVGSRNAFDFESSSLLKHPEQAVDAYYSASVA